MEPQFRFCTSADGTRIAYSTYGDPAARALVFVKNFDRAQEYWWKYEGSRALYEGLASSRRVVTFDRRGVGDSQRDVEDMAMPTQVADLAAVVEHIGLESFDLLGQVTGAALAVAYATEHPERVGRFVLLRPFMRTLGSPPQGLLGMAQAIRANWPIERRSMATFAIPNGPTEAQR